MPIPNGCPDPRLSKSGERRIVVDHGRQPEFAFKDLTKRHINALNVGSPDQNSIAGCDESGHPDSDRTNVRRDHLRRPLERSNRHRLGCCRSRHLYEVVNLAFPVDQGNRHFRAAQINAERQADITQCRIVSSL